MHMYSFGWGRVSSRLLLAGFVVFAACGLWSQSACAETTSLQGAGATFPAPLYKLWIEAFKEKNPDVTINYDAVGSGEGIKRFVGGAVDFGASDAALSDDEIKQVQRGAVLIPGTAGLVVIAYNVPGLVAPLKLPRSVYPDIFSGEIRSWDDPRIKEANPGLSLPKRNITLVARLDRSGTTFALSNHLSAVSEAWKKDFGVGTAIEWPGDTMLVRGNEGVASRVKISEGSIGYMEYGFAGRLGLPMAELENQAGQYVTPGEESGRSALAESVSAMGESMRVFVRDPAGPTAYPIVTYSWLLLYKQYTDAARKDALMNFVSWGLTSGQKFAPDLGYIGLPESVASRGILSLDGIR